MTLDGQSRDLVNYWQGVDVSAGSQLIFCLQLKQTKKYVLNHYYKGVVTQGFPDLGYTWQIVPRTLLYTDTEVLDHTENGVGVGAGLPADARRAAVLRSYLEFAECPLALGHWRVAQTFTAKRKYSSDDEFTDDSAFLKGQLLQVTFAPIWKYGSHCRVRTRFNSVLLDHPDVTKRHNVIVFHGALDNAVDTQPSRDGSDIDMCETAETGVRFAADAAPGGAQEAPTRPLERSLRDAPPADAPPGHAAPPANATEDASSDRSATVEKSASEGGKSRKRADSTAVVVDSVALPEDGTRKKEKKKKTDLFAIPAETTLVEPPGSRGVHGM